MEAIHLTWAKIQVFLTPKMIVGLTAISAVMAVGSLFIMPYILCKLPANYFVYEKPHLFHRMKSSTPLKALMLVAKNISGFLLFIAGILMLFLPGQGLLTMLIGLVVMDFPGKAKLERKIITAPKVLTTVNWFRARRGHPEMTPPLRQSL